MKYVKCDICDTDNCIVLEAMGRFKEPVTNVVCRGCGLVYQNPRMDSAEIKKFYSSEYSEFIYSVIPEGYISHGNKVRFTYIRNYLHTYTTSVLNILEIGSAHGVTLELLRQEGHLVKGIEPSQSLYELSKRKGLDVFNGYLENFTDNITYDLILAFHVIEHVEFPTAFLKKVKTLLKEDGRFIIETPDIWHLQGDPHTGDDYLLCKEHTFTFSENSLRVIAQRAGLTINSLPRQMPKHIWAEFRIPKQTGELKKGNKDNYDDYIEIVKHVFNYRSNYSWRQRLFNTRFIYIHLLINRLFGEKGLAFTKFCYKKVGLKKVIEWLRC
ncbi:MAG: class I SAM-dependent methyltransferase [Deltaproteobacteria bacterium]|nr:class I SAM-dependent methyltransferase [Deltaproteobacteria bacterium]